MELKYTNLSTLGILVDGISSELHDQVTVSEISMTESLSTPGLMTTIILQSATNTDRHGEVSSEESETPVKNLDEYYAKVCVIAATRPILRELYGDSFKWEFKTEQIIYRLSDRVKINYNVEQYRLDLCDPSLLLDAKRFISKSWKNVTPDEVVRDVLGNLPTVNLDVEEVNPKKDYIAGYLHPFQIVNQQSELSLTKTNKVDPSLVHFMTYQNINGQDIPTHNFRSLTAMAKQEPIFDFAYSAKDTQDLNYSNPHDIMTYSFPLDFDALSDVLNGVDYKNGKSFIQMNALNSLTNRVSGFGAASSGPATTPWIERSNLGTEDTQNSAPLASEQIKVLRRARMGLIEQGNIALNMTVPFSPFLNAGRTITATFYNTQNGSKNYGTGKYLIVNMTHNIKMGGLGITMLECVSDSVQRGVA